MSLGDETLQNEDSKPKILIVDDVLGELDLKHRRIFLQQLEQAHQVLVACTEVPPELSTAKTIFQVSGGQIRQRS